MNIPEETKEQGPLLDLEISFGPNYRTMMERLRKVLQFITTLDKRLKIKNTEFINDSNKFVYHSTPIYKEYTVKERPGVFFYIELNAHKDIPCRCIVKYEQGEKKPVYMNMSDYDKTIHSTDKS